MNKSCKYPLAFMEIDTKSLYFRTIVGPVLLASPPFRKWTARYSKALGMDSGDVSHTISCDVEHVALGRK